MGKGEGAAPPAANESSELRPRKTPFIHRMDKAVADPRSPHGVVCPSYYVLSHANGCPYRCDYCCLQLPLKNVQKPVVFTNQDGLVDEVNAFLKRGRPQVLSAGESSDSLALKSHARLFCRLIPLFARQDEDKLFPKEHPHKLLLVTKSKNVEMLLPIKEKANTILSFSLNAPSLAAMYEHGAPRPFERLNAAIACKEAGYEVRLRIDPILPVEQWQEVYLPLIERLRRELGPTGRLGHTRITLGTIRHNPGLRDCTLSRGRNDHVFDAATSQDGADGRFRLPAEQRCEMYAWFKSQLEPNADIALCKETTQVWQTLDLPCAIPRCNCAL